jgi:SAM-dependent methyltransferase
MGTAQALIPTPEAAAIMEEIRGDIYDYPKYYDVLFGSDWKAEFDFLRACFQKHAKRKVRRVFEPACGTGRLMVKMAAAGYYVAGNDLNVKAVEYCNARLKRHGFAATASLGDMADFRLARKVDAAFSTINSFRHLQTRRQAEDHLLCVARALAKGGIYVLGLHLTPDRPACTTESWTARRGNLRVLSRMWSIHIDRRRRKERVGFRFDIYTPTRQFRLVDEFVFRTYTSDQFLRLLRRVDSLELVETYDFGYQIDEPVQLTRNSEDVVFVLRKV